MPFVSLSIGSNNGWSYLISIVLCFLFMKSSSMPLCIGPGLKSARTAIISSNFSGFNFFIRSRMPELSNWNRPMDSALARSSNVFLSSRGILSMSISRSLVLFMIFIVSLTTVSVLSPRKSIFKRPIFSSEVMGTPVVICPSLVSNSGT